MGKGLFCFLNLVKIKGHYFQRSVESLVGYTAERFKTTEALFRTFNAVFISFTVPHSGNCFIVGKFHCNSVGFILSQCEISNP